MHSLRCILLLLLICIWSADARADRRVALVIGNSAYQHVPNLPNPTNDAEAISILFKSAGFDLVQTQENLGINDMRRVVRDFSDSTRDADIAVIYYAGHGMEVSGINYLVPVDASLRRDIDVEDEAVSLDRLLQVMEPAKRLRLVILDACRDNHFVKSMARTMANRTIGRGLARVEPTTSDTLVAFAAKAGLTAADGDGAHSPFTTALLRNLVTPGLDVRLAFGRVRDEVLSSTGKKQEPFVYGSLGGATVTLASLTTEERQPSALSSADPDAPAARDYEAAAKIGTKEAWDSFLVAHPKGFYADLAKVRRANLSTSIEPIENVKPKESTKKVAPSQDIQSQTKKATKAAQAGGCVERCYAVVRTKCAKGEYSCDAQNLASAYKGCRDAHSKYGTTYCYIHGLGGP